MNSGLSDTYRPILSIIIPTFNSIKTIGRCIESVLNQNFREYEVLIIDGKSNDGTFKLVEQFIKSDYRVNGWSERDNGIYDAMNVGIDKARGDWILFLGSDDELYNDDVLENVFINTEYTCVDFVYGDVFVKGDCSWAMDGTTYDGIFTVNKLIIKNICQQAIFYRKKLFSILGKFNIRYETSADWDMNHRWFAKTNTLYVPYIITIFNGGGKSTKVTSDQYTNFDCVHNLRKYYKISSFNYLLRPYFYIFDKLAIESLNAKSYCKFIYYFIVSLIHSQNKMIYIKSYLIKIYTKILIKT